MQIFVRIRTHVAIQMHMALMKLQLLYNYQVGRSLALVSTTSNDKTRHRIHFAHAADRAPEHDAPVPGGGFTTAAAARDAWARTGHSTWAVTSCDVTLRGGEGPSTTSMGYHSVKKVPASLVVKDAIPCLHRTLTAVESTGCPPDPSQMFGRRSGRLRT